jgi:hypothetical protein
MKQCPSEANSSSASQKVPVLCGTKVYCHVYESLPPFPVWSQMNHFLAPIPISWRSILILSLHLSPGLQSGCFLRFSNQDSVCTSPLPHTRHMPHLSHFWVDNLNSVWWGVQILKLLDMLSSLLLLIQCICSYLLHLQAITICSLKRHHTMWKVPAYHGFLLPLPLMKWM